ncbi:hypothetical protein L6164_004836 [Bauhinia variegata]|uniref:Uncharacterized protein n=1 Tax=Bauhinia variegata TaxID=167791 RepID=A0ACB9PUW3_BAUVA|nr:hypothetical protein L6164_004836 [Bauhinia variegata]
MAEHGGFNGLEGIQSQSLDLDEDPNQHLSLSEIVPTIQNVVATCSLDCDLDLKKIAQHARNAEYNPRRFSAVIMRIREPKTTALIFSSGKLVCTGAKSEQLSKLAARKFARIIQKLGYPAQFKIQNMVGSCDLKFPLRLESLACAHGAFSSYEPELFPGLIYRMKQPKIVLLVFVSGKIVLTGAKVARDEINLAFENIYPVLAGFRKIQQWRSVKGMAQFTTQGRLKLLFNGEGVSSRLELKDPFHCKLRSIQSHKRRLRYFGSSGRLHYSSSLSGQTNRCNAEANLTGSGEGVYDEDDSDLDAFENDDLSCFRGLVLDISYRPVNVVGWRRAICLEFMEKADVLEYYDQTVNSPSGSFYIPAVLRVPHLLQVVKRRIVKSSLSRKNILFRDNYTCQYCSSRENLTIDHVIPTSLGGEWKWENLVTACAKCNSKKGQKTLEEAKMKLNKVPKAPKDYDILAIPLTSAALRMLSIRKGTPEEWRQYLARPSLEP